MVGKEDWFSYVRVDKSLIELAFGQSLDPNSILDRIYYLVVLSFFSLIRLLSFFNHSFPLFPFHVLPYFLLSSPSLSDSY